MISCFAKGIIAMCLETKQLSFNQEASSRFPGLSCSLCVHVLGTLSCSNGTLFILSVPLKPFVSFSRSTTDVDGHLDKSSLASLQLKTGTYKLRFETGEYWQQQGQPSFYPYADVVFIITEAERRVHIPLLMSPYSYTTYRGN
uniref:5-hydroxyisourate hydrolase n=1 Tax=Anolis carolinensis TaxID=28377 RepID=A0A803U126_ANOCA